MDLSRLKKKQADQLRFSGFNGKRCRRQKKRKEILGILRTDDTVRCFKVSVRRVCRPVCKTIATLLKDLIQNMNQTRQRDEVTHFVCWLLQWNILQPQTQLLSYPSPSDGRSAFLPPFFCERRRNVSFIFCYARVK